MMGELCKEDDELALNLLGESLVFRLSVALGLLTKGLPDESVYKQLGEILLLEEFRDPLALCACSHNQEVEESSYVAERERFIEGLACMLEILDVSGPCLLAWNPGDTECAL